jgi:hypothetical protein
MMVVAVGGGVVVGEVGYYSHAKNKTAGYCLTVS